MGPNTNGMEDGDMTRARTSSLLFSPLTLHRTSSHTHQIEPAIRGDEFSLVYTTCWLNVTGV